jgi:hypothetical protein
MPVDFDQIRDQDDRVFIIRGESFTIQNVRPEVMEDVNALEDAFVAIPEPKYSDVVELAEKRLLLFLDDENGAVDRWKVLRERKLDPISYREITEISKLVLEKATGLPTMPPPDSGNGGDSTTGSSSVGSS